MLHDLSMHATTPDGPVSGKLKSGYFNKVAPTWRHDPINWLEVHWLPFGGDGCGLGSTFPVLGLLFFVQASPD